MAKMKIRGAIPSHPGVPPACSANMYELITMLDLPSDRFPFQQPRASPASGPSLSPCGARVCLTAGAYRVFTTGRLTTRYSQQGTTRDGELRVSFDLLTRKKMRAFPKSNRMPDAPHSVKVETQVVDSVQDLRQHFIGCIKMTQISPRIPTTHST